MHRRPRSYLSLTFGLCFTMGLASQATCQSIRGDVNNDGVVDSKDALAVLRFVNGLATLTPEEQARADVAPLPGTQGRAVGDGQVTTADVQQILRYLVGLIPRAALTGQFEGPAISGFTPSAGAAGTQVTISGVNFVPNSTTDNQVTLGDAACKVLSATPTELVVEVPAGAQTGYLTVTTPGGSASTENVFALTSTQPGQLVLPARSRGRQSTTDFVVESDVGNVSPDGQGGFDLPLTSARFTPVIARPKSGADQSFLSIYSPEVTGKLEVSAHSTAVSLLFLHPGLIPSDNYPITAVLSTIESLPQTAVLAKACEDAFVAGADPVTDPTVQTALKSAFEALFAALPQSQSAAPQQSVSRAALNPEDLRAGIPYLRKLDIQALNVSLYLHGQQDVLKIGNRLLTPVDWFTRLVQLDPKDFPNGFPDLEKIDRLKEYDQLATIRTGMVTARGLFNYMSFVSDIFGGLLEGGARIVSPDISIFSSPTVNLDDNKAGIYLLRCFSGAFPNTDPVESQFPLIGGSNSTTALLLNLVGVSMDLTNAILGVTGSKELQAKIVRAIAISVAKKAGQVGLLNAQRSASSRATGDIVQILWDIVSSTLKSVSESLAKELVAHPRVKEALTSLVNSFNLFGKVASFAKVGERISALVVGYPPSAVLNLLGDAVGKVTPMETALVVIGDPFAPIILDHPTRVLPDQEFVITGRGFSPTASDDRVILGNQDATVVSVSSDGTQLHVKASFAVVDGRVLVKCSRGQAVSDKRITVGRLPQIDSVTPTAGFAANPNPPAEFQTGATNDYPGSVVTITGSEFNPAKDTVQFGSANAVTDVSQSSDTKLVVHVPQGATSPLMIHTAEDEGAGNSRQVPFQVIGSPQLSSASPSTARTGARIALQGSNLPIATDDALAYTRVGGVETPAPVSSVAGNALVLQVQSTVTTVQGATPTDVRIVTPAGSAALTAAFTLQPGLANGSQIFVATDADTVAADDSLSLREAILLATEGVAPFEAQRGAPLTEQEKERIQPGHFDKNNAWVLDQPPGPLAKDVIKPVGTYTNQTTVLTSALPPLDSGFDTITFQGGKRFAVNATGVTGPALTVSSDSNGVGGLSVSNCSGAAIRVTGNGNSIFLLGATLLQNAIGVQIDGGSNNTVTSGDISAFGTGIDIMGDAVGNTISNVIVGDLYISNFPPGTGIHLHGAGVRGTVLKACDVEQTEKTAVLIDDGAQATTITAITVRDNSDGIRIGGGSGVTSGTKMEGGSVQTTDGNGVTIGPSAADTVITDLNAAQPVIQDNGGHGIAVIGGATTGTSITNVRLDDNGQCGITISHAASGDPVGTRVENCNIGTSGQYGIFVSAAVADVNDQTIVKNNTIFGSKFAAIRLEGQHLLVDGNHVNGLMNIFGQPAPVREAVGLESAGARDALIRGNVIDSTTDDGIQLLSGTTRVTVEGGSVQNCGGNGVLLNNADHCTLRGITTSFNTKSGVVMQMSSHNQLLFNTSQQDANGQPQRGQVTNNQQDGIRLEAGCQDDLIAGQDVLFNRNGIVVQGQNTANNRVQICNVSANSQDGIALDPAATATVIGGSEALRNLISGNTGWGVHLLEGTSAAAPAQNVVLAGNFIGTNDTGDAFSSNKQGGVRIEQGWRNVVIGGRGFPPAVAGGLPTEGNLISGNDGPGISINGDVDGVRIDGNVIGLRLAGDSPLRNDGRGIDLTSVPGVALTRIAPQNVAIGAISGNVVSGNTGDGIHLDDLTAARVMDNLIGTDTRGARRFGNAGDGIALFFCTSALVEGNFIVDNKRGITVESGNKCMIVRNSVGLGTAGQRLGQRGTGIALTGILGPIDTVLKDNAVVLSTAAFGIALGNGAGNRVVAGSIFSNEAGGISASSPAPPTVTVVRMNLVAGETAAGTKDGSVVQVYADGGGQGQRYLGQTTVHNRVWQLRTPVPQNLNITATLTDTDGDTSGFGGVGPSTLPPPVKPGPAPNPTAEPFHQQQVMVFTSTRDGNAEIYSRTPGESEDVRLTNNPAADHSPALSPDASKVAFVSERSGNPDIWQLDFLGTPPVSLIASPSPDYDPAWSPDGSKIAFTSERDGNPEIYVANADGSNVQRLTNAAGVDRQPAWSPDGSKIAFASDRAGHTDIWLMNADGSGATPVTTNAAPDYSPAFSPDGTTIAFISERDGNPEIYTVTQNQAPTRVTDTAAAEQTPVWSPDSAWLAFSSNAAGDAEIFALDLADKREDRLTVSLGLNTDPDWRSVAPGRAALMAHLLSTR